uniref:Mitochondria-eating protein n=1 Tax=Rhodnius prolixus TaxID=13249 RepID=T1IEX4_RHOPR
MNRYYEGYRRPGAMLTLPPPPLTDPGATWTSYTSEPVRAGQERFKPERSRHGVNLHKLQWRNSNWVDGFPEMVSSMTIADVSPRFAVKRIILLYENSQYREAANFINRLSHGTFKTILTQLPIDLFVETMPHSVSILEALYAKVFLSSDCGIRVLRPESVLMQLVKLFAGTGSPDRWLASARKLLKVIVLSEPKLKKALQVKRRALDKAVEGLGQHGLVGTTDESMTNLHDALKVEFQRLVDTYKTALQKLEELSLSGKKNDGKTSAPIQASHQRQLSLKQADIQERLIKNKTLLNVVEPATSNRSAAILLAILQRRVECDKDALFQFTQLRKELKMESEQVVAPLLMRYSHACDQVLELMKEVGDDEDSSDISGYHSDSDSAIMMSGNSPYVTKRARHNFLTRSRSTTDWEWSPTKSNTCRSVVSTEREPTITVPDTTSHQNEVASLQSELERTRMELEQTKTRLQVLDAHAQAKELSGPRLVRCYGNLYSQGRVEALNSLDALSQLKDDSELKSKILFSVVVLAFMASGSQLSTKREQVKRILLSPAPQSNAHKELEEAVATYLRRTVDTFDLAHCIEEVSSQLWATLYDYPCLKSCMGLQQYIKDSVRLAWALVNQATGYCLEYEERIFRRELHVRLHSADTECNTIRTYLWPALLESPGGNCVYKAVVLT